MKRILRHVADDGRVLSRDCSLCHASLTHELAPDRRSAAVKLMEYPHPVDIGDAYLEGRCVDCHGPS